MPQYSLLDLFHYAFCFLGMFTGPVLTYRTYHDFIHQRFNPVAVHKKPEILYRLKFFLVIIPAFLLFSRFKSAYLHTEEFAETSVLFKIAYMFPLFTMFRVRMYIGWLLAEICFIVAGFGAYPKSSDPKPGVGPTKGACAVYDEVDKQADELSFETIRNVDVIATETQLTMQDGVRGWNMCVQWWLVQYTFRQCPVKAMR